MGNHGRGALVSFLSNSKDRLSFIGVSLAQYGQVICWYS